MTNKPRDHYGRVFGNGRPSFVTCTHENTSDTSEALSELSTLLTPVGDEPGL